MHFASLRSRTYGIHQQRPPSSQKSPHSLGRWLRSGQSWSWWCLCRAGRRRSLLRFKLTRNRSGRNGHLWHSALQVAPSPRVSHPHRTHAPQQDRVPLSLDRPHVCDPPAETPDQPATTYEGTVTAVGTVFESLVLSVPSWPSAPLPAHQNPSPTGG